MWINFHSDNSTLEPLTVTLVSSDPGKLKIPATVVIPRRRSSASIDIEGLSSGGDGDVMVTATAPGIESGNVTIRIAQASLSLSPYLRLPHRISTLPLRYPVEIQIMEGNSYPRYRLAEDLTVNLSLEGAQPSNIVSYYLASHGGQPIDQVAFLAGGRRPSVTVYVGEPTAIGTYKLRATAQGFTAAVSGEATVSRPILKLSGTLQNGRVPIDVDGPNSIRLSRSFDGSDYSPDSYWVTVTLGCYESATGDTASTKCRVVPSVVIPRSTASVNVSVEGLTEGNAVLRAVDASGDYSAASLNLRIVGSGQ